MRVASHMCEGNHWVLRYAIGLPPSAMGVAMTDAEAPVSALVAASRRPVAIADMEQESELDLALMLRFGIRSVLALPLVVRDKVIGVLAFNYFQPRTAFSASEMEFADKLALSASLALENARLLENESREREAAEQRAAELEATLDAISEGVVMYGPDGRILRLNAAASHLLGYGPNELPLSIAERGVRLRSELVDKPGAGPDDVPTARALRGETVRGELLSVHPLTGQMDPLLT